MMQNVNLLKKTIISVKLVFIIRGKKGNQYIIFHLLSNIPSSYIEYYPTAKGKLVLTTTLPSQAEFLRHGRLFSTAKFLGTA